MLPRRVWSLAALVARSFAFQDTSPFFAFSSTSHDLIGSSFPRVTTSLASHITTSISTYVQSCPSDAYVVVSQPATSTLDYNGMDTMPHLAQRFTAEPYAMAAIPDVVGTIDATHIAQHISQHCNVPFSTLDATNGIIDLIPATAQVIHISFPALPSPASQRATQLRAHDSYLATVLSSLPGSYTLLYTTSAELASLKQLEPQQHVFHSFDYDLEEPAPSSLHTGLKRDFADHTQRAPVETKATDDRALFETYSFLSPGIFMGLFTAFLLLSILYVGVSAVASLQVSYAAFSKEMGPAAQKGKAQ